MGKYEEEYRGYIIRVIGNEVFIYNKNSLYVKSAGCNNIKGAKIKIDKIIKNSK